MLIPHDMLTDEALQGLLDEFVTRDGTELTDAVKKIAQVRRLLESGKAAISYDEGSESCTIVLTES